jgi:hypothetical protein
LFLSFEFLLGVFELGKVMEGFFVWNRWTNNNVTEIGWFVLNSCLTPLFQ